MGLSENQGTLFRGPYNKDPIIQGTILGSFHFRKHPSSVESVERAEASRATPPLLRCGFLGLLHLDVFRQRLSREYGASSCSAGFRV